MNCLRCNNKMKIAVLTGDALGTPAWLHYKKKGIFETEDEVQQIATCAQNVVM